MSETAAADSTFWLQAADKEISTLPVTFIESSANNDGRCGSNGSRLRRKRMGSAVGIATASVLIGLANAAATEDLSVGAA